MGVIIRCSLLERMRKKELYIILVIGILMILFCCTGESTISVGGNVLTGFDNMLMVFHILMNFFCCILAVVLSVHTIPDEYDRKNSHLVWIRGVSQQKYHGSLCIANCIVSLIALLSFYIMLVIYMFANGHAELVLHVVPAYFITAINVICVSLFVSVLSIKLPCFLVGMLGVFCSLIGILSPLLLLLKNILGGLGGKLIQILLKVIPNLHAIQAQAYQCILGNSVNVHAILSGLLAIYIVSLGVFIFRRSEA